MTDINPTLDRIAHGAYDHHLRLKGHHENAAMHHERAAEHHRRAAQAHEAQDNAAAGAYATTAYSHGAHAQHHATESLKGYAMEPGMEGSGSTESAEEGVLRSGGGESPSTGYPTGGESVMAPATNPDAAFTPGISGASDQRAPR